MPIKINFLSNTREIIRDATSLGHGLERVSDALDDVAHDAQRSGSNLSDALTDAGRDGERSAQRLEKSFKEASDATARAGETGGAGFSRAVKHSSEEASEGVGTFKDEAKANLSEVASSFDGSSQSIIDLFQGTLGGVVQDLGPLGLAAGAVGAAGVGLIGAAITSVQAKQQALQQKTSDLATEMIEEGKRGAVGYGYVADQLKSLATQQDALGVDLLKIKRISDESDGSFKELAQAYAGNVENIDQLVQKYRDQQAELIRTNHISGDAAASYEGDNSKRINADQQYLNKLSEVQSEAHKAAAEQKLYIKSGAADLANAANATQSYADGVQSAYADAGSSIENYVKDGAFNLAQYTKDAKAQADAIASYQANMVTLAGQLSAAALQYVESLGPAAAPAINAFVHAPLAQQQATADVWNRLGSTSGASYNSSLQNHLDASPASKTVTLHADTRQLDNAIGSYQNKIVTVQVRGGTSALGRQVI